MSDNEEGSKDYANSIAHELHANKKLPSLTFANDDANQQIEAMRQSILRAKLRSTMHIHVNRMCTRGCTDQIYRYLVAVVRCLTSLNVHVGRMFLHSILALDPKVYCLSESIS